MAKPKGRPKGSPNTQVIADVEPSRCPNPDCGSTERGPYLGSPNVQEFAGEINGQPYTHIVRRRCRCAACDQIRIDRTFENRTPALEK